MWHDKDPSLLKGRKRQSKFAALHRQWSLLHSVKYFPAVGKLRQTKPNVSLLQIKAYFAFFFWELSLGKNPNL